jgi:UDP-4-amino-4,6-dideoxy-N-acetyl-beta-L-altrosamine transaminase
MIPYGRQDISEEDLQAVQDVLRSDYLTQGPVVPTFEKAIAAYVGAEHGVAVNSATSALHIACLALGLGPQDWLWTSSISFVASANCALYCGANVDFVDIDSRTYNLCTEALEQKLIVAEKQGRLPKIVVPVHLCGQPCDMARIHALAVRYGFKIIEDASHAIGGKYKDEPIGSGRYSDITVFSFHPVKIITTAEGGLAVTNSAELAEKMTLFRSHGITRDEALMTHETDGPWYYQQVALGFNYRMTELQAALGLSQFKRLDAFVARRHFFAKRYDQLLSLLPIEIPWQHPDSYSGLHLYVVRVKSTKGKQVRRAVFEALRAKDIGVNVHYIPIHTQPYYQSLGVEYSNLDESERYYQEAITLPLFPAMTEVEQDYVVASLSEALAQVASQLSE